MRRHLLNLIPIGLVAFASLLADVAGLPSARAAGTIVAQGQFGAEFDIKEHETTVTINNGIAVTEIEQTFVNTEDRRAEAVYIFPVPKGASVANFSMRINGKEMVGEVVERERAREIYNSYKEQNRDPGLLEKTSSKRFEMRIFPIEPNAEQKLRLSYYQDLDFDHNWASYTYPLSTAGHKTMNQTTIDTFAFTLRVKSEVPITKMTSPSHGQDLVISENSKHFYEASYETTGGDLSRDIVIDYKIARPRTGLDLVTSRPKGKKGYFLMTLTPGKRLDKMNRAKDYVFVLDVSGSMGKQQKLSLTTRSVSAFVDQLSDKDRFELLSFNVQPSTLFDGLRPASDQHKQQAREFLKSRQARGGTRLKPAIETAYKYGNPDRPLNVVILSDGMTEKDERGKLMRLVKQRPGHARVFAIGVGNEIDRPLLRQLATEAGGLADFVSRGADFDRKAKAFRRKLTRPVATNVKINIDGVGAHELVPQELPNLYHGAPVRLYGRYGEGGEAQVTLTGQVLGRPLKRQVTLNFSKEGGNNPEIERMWAWHRIQALKHQAPDGELPSDVRREIVRLGELYSIATRYTSFLVLENNEEYERWKIERRNALRLARDRGKREAVEQQLEQLRQQATRKLGPAPAAPSDTADEAQQAQRDVDRSQAGDTPLRISSGSDGSSQQSDVSNTSNSRNSSGGGAALGPVSGALALGLGGLAALNRRRCRRRRGRAD